MRLTLLHCYAGIASAMSNMRLFAGVVLLVVGALAVPTPQRFFWLPDSDGKLHLVDRSAAPAVVPRFDGAEDVTLYLYTQGNPLIPEFIKLDDDTSSPSFNPNNPTRFVIHGWISNAQNLEGYRDAYIATGGEYNIVLVDWSGPASEEVATSTKSSVLVGDYVGQVINHLIAARGLDPDNLYIIGHSMGGHVAGVVGNRVGGGIAAQVVALDPANGIYDANPLEDKLDKSDGKFVQVIHTNGGSTGQLENNGDADFFPNGGSRQVGCGIIEELLLGCSHNRAPLYYVESIISQNFVATLCSSYDEYTQGACSANEHVLMGEYTPLTVSGSYYLDTNPSSPYALGQTDL